MADTRVPDLYAEDKKELDILSRPIQEQIDFVNQLVTTHNRLIFAGDPYRTAFGLVWQKEIYHTGFIFTSMKTVLSDGKLEFTTSLTDSKDKNFRQIVTVFVNKDRKGSFGDVSKNLYQFRNMMEMFAIQVSEELYDIEHMR